MLVVVVLVLVFFGPTRLRECFVVRVVIFLTLEPWIIAGLFSRWPQLGSQVHKSLSESNVLSRHARGLQSGPVRRRLCFQCVVGVIWVYSTRTNEGNRRLIHCVKCCTGTTGIQTEKKKKKTYTTNMVTPKLQISQAR